MRAVWGKSGRGSAAGGAPVPPPGPFAGAQRLGPTVGSAAQSARLALDVRILCTHEWDLRTQRRVLGMSDALVPSSDNGGMDYS